jgi:ATP-dependent Zn protease
MNNSKNILTSMLVNNTRTGNQIIDYLISFFILSSITYVFQNIKYFKKNILILYSYIKNNDNKSELIIDAQNVTYDRNGTKLNKLLYSKIFQAVTYYIKELKSDEIYSKREPDKNEKDSNPMFDVFIPDQDKPFFLNEEKTIKCLIKLNEYEINNKNNTEFKKNHVIKIFSENINIKITDLEDFVDTCLIKYNKYLQKKTINDQYYFCFNSSDANSEILYFTEKIFKTNRTFDSIFFENKNNYIKNLDFFLKNENWYIKKGIPYHYGILLHGKPGCGKTSIIKATLEYTKRHALVIPLNRVKTCGALENIFFESEINNKNIPTEKRIYIFEDIDCLCNIVKDRELDSDDDFSEIKVKSELEILSKFTDLSYKKIPSPEDELNLSCLLNIFDGILETPGRIIILTSNYPDKIDKALLRPGRIDTNIELKKASVNIIKEMLQSFYDISIEKIENLSQNKILDYVLTPAEVMNICQNNIFNFENAIKQITHK